MPIKLTTTTGGGGRAGRKNEVTKLQKNLQNKQKNKNNKCFSWVSAVRVLSQAGNHSPPYLPRMPSNTVLLSGPAVGAGQILIWFYSCVSLPAMSTAVRASVFPLWARSMAFSISHRQSPPGWSCGFHLQLAQLEGWFGVSFLSHAAPGFQSWFYFLLYMWVIH